MVLTELTDRGFVYDADEVFSQYIKTINPMVDLVFQIAPVFEIFIWVKDEDFEDPDMDGQRIGLETIDVDKAIELAEIVAYVE